MKISKNYMGTNTNPAGNSSFTISSFLEEYLHSAAHGWSIGIPGAIGEFMYDDDEEVEFQIDASHLCVTTPRGAMHVRLNPDLKCIAYEEVSSCTRSWSQNVGCCVPEDRAKLIKNNTLTYLGFDEKAISAGSKHTHLFDIGVGSPYVQFCVRSSDAELVQVLKENCGRSIFAPGNPASAAVLEYSPARVVISAMGRIEIETRIPQSASETLTGPHTHLLPALLTLKASKSTSGLPAGYVECLTLYPEHPVFDKYGVQHAFQESAHNKFQNLLSDLGPDGYIFEKNRINAGPLIDSGKHETSSTASSLQHHAQRIARLQEPFLHSL